MPSEAIESRVLVRLGSLSREAHERARGSELVELHVVDGRVRDMPAELGVAPEGMAVPHHGEAHRGAQLEQEEVVVVVAGAELRLAGRGAEGVTRELQGDVEPLARHRDDVGLLVPAQDGGEKDHVPVRVHGTGDSDADGVDCAHVDSDAVAGRLRRDPHAVEHALDAAVHVRQLLGVAEEMAEVVYESGAGGGAADVNAEKRHGCSLCDGVRAMRERPGPCPPVWHETTIFQRPFCWRPLCEPDTAFRQDVMRPSRGERRGPSTSFSTGVYLLPVWPWKVAGAARRLWPRP